MLIKVRNKDGKLLVKDVLDIDFDMSISEIEDGTNKNHKSYAVRLNHSLTLAERFDSEKAAEIAMENIAEDRNQLEEDLRNW